MWTPGRWQRALLRASQRVQPSLQAAANGGVGVQPSALNNVQPFIVHNLPQALGGIERARENDMLDRTLAEVGSEVSSHST